MPRTMVDGEIFRNPDFAMMSYEAQVLYLGLELKAADQWGRGIWLPAELKAEVFRHDNRMKAGKVAKLMGEVLELMGEVLAYEVDGTPYFQLLDWEKTCKLTGRKPSRYPEPPETAGKQAKLFEWRQALVKKGVFVHQVQGQGQGQVKSQDQGQDQGHLGAEVTTGVAGLSSQSDLTPTDIDDLTRTTELVHDNKVAQLSTLYSALRKQLPAGTNWLDLVSAHLRAHGENNVMRVYGKALHGRKRISAPDVYFKAAFAEPPPEP